MGDTIKQAVRETIEYCFRVLKYSVRGDVLRYLYQKYRGFKQPPGSEFYFCIHKDVLVSRKALFVRIQAGFLLCREYIPYTRAVSIIIHLGCKVAVCSVRKQEAVLDANRPAHGEIIVPQMLRKPYTSKLQPPYSPKLQQSKVLSSTSPQKVNMKHFIL